MRNSSAEFGARAHARATPHLHSHTPSLPQPLIDDSGRTVHPDSELLEIRSKVWQRGSAICAAETRPVEIEGDIISARIISALLSAAGLEMTGWVVLIRHWFGKAAPADCGWKSHK